VRGDLGAFGLLAQVLLLFLEGATWAFYLQAKGGKPAWRPSTCPSFKAAGPPPGGLEGPRGEPAAWPEGGLPFPHLQGWSLASRSQRSLAPVGPLPLPDQDRPRVPHRHEAAVAKDHVSEGVVAAQVLRGPVAPIGGREGGGSRAHRHKAPFSVGYGS
jgi:hypothetical protein